MYTVVLTKSAEKELERLDAIICKRIATKLDLLERDPRPDGCKKLQGSSGYWRVRAGDYRIIYSVSDKTKTVDIHSISHRQSAYNP